MLSNSTPLVAGSIPAREKEVQTSTCFCSLVVECLPSKEVVRVRFPTEANRVQSAREGRVAQWIERLTSDQEVVGSIPTVVMAWLPEVWCFFLQLKKHLVDTET